MNEEVPTGAENQEPALTGIEDDIVLECQAHTALKSGPQKQQPGEHQNLTIETEGRLVGRDNTPVPAADVFKLAAIGCKDTEIAEWFGIDPNSLRYNFKVELLKGRETLKQSLRRKQISVAMSGNPTMLIFLGKNLLGQSDSPLNASEKTALPWEDGE
jgi:hypothetical protein